MPNPVKTQYFHIEVVNQHGQTIEQHYLPGNWLQLHNALQVGISESGFLVVPSLCHLKINHSPYTFIHNYRRQTTQTLQITPLLEHE